MKTNFLYCNFNALSEYSTMYTIFPNSAVTPIPTDEIAPAFLEMLSGPYLVFLG